MPLKRLIYFLLINLLVSAVTTLVVLTLWDRAHQTRTGLPEAASPQVLIPTATQEQAAQLDEPGEPEISLQAYQVAEGETLGEIAFAYNITMEELLALNGLTDPDSIGAGATIFVPTSPLPALAGEGAGEAEESDASTAGGNVDIVAVIGAGDLRSERVQLRGRGDATLSLTGWRLQDEDGNEYIFPQITLFGSGAVEVYSTTGVDTVVALYWNSGAPLWGTGETVTLLDEAGNLQATYTVP